MKGIFKCVQNQTDTIPVRLLDQLGCTYEEANKNSTKMADLAILVKKDKARLMPIVPFCHTVEAESFGSSITYDSELGNRIASYAIKTEEDMENFSKLDLNSPRIKVSLDAISDLKARGEQVIFNVTGPISIATSLMDTGLFYKLIRKDKERLFKFLSLIEESIIDFIRQASLRGADLISYADPAGTIDIVGPKTYKDISGKSTYNILKNLEGELEDTVIHLCGKTSTSLAKVDLIDIETFKSNRPTYLEKIKDLKNQGEGVDFVGNWCLKMDVEPKLIMACKLR